MGYCERCRENKAEYEIEIPIQEEKIKLCKECYLLVWELFARWMNIKSWEMKLLKFENKLDKK